jgi:hypothetical protein
MNRCKTLSYNYSTTTLVHLLLAILRLSAGGNPGGKHM